MGNGNIQFVFLHIKCWQTMHETTATVTARCIDTRRERTIIVLVSSSGSVSVHSRVVALAIAAIELLRVSPRSD